MIYRVLSVSLSVPELNVLSPVPVWSFPKRHHIIYSSDGGPAAILSDPALGGLSQRLASS